MAGIAADLKTYVTAATSVNAVISGRMHQNSPPQESSKPFIWYRRSNENTPLTMDGAAGIHRVEFDVECITTDPVTSESLADKVKTRLNGASGAFGSSTVQGAFVNDHLDDYLPKGVGGDSGLIAAAFNVLIWYTT